MPPSSWIPGARLTSSSRSGPGPRSLTASLRRPRHIRGPLEVCGAESTARRVGRDVAEASRALHHLGLGHRRRLVACLELRVWGDHEEVKDRRDDDEGDDHVEEVAVEELAVVDGEEETWEGRLAEPGRDDK